MSLIGNIGKIYREVSDRVTAQYEETYGLDCNVYFPVNTPNPDANGNYDNINLYASHGVIPYSDTPNIEDVKFYIPYLLKKETMISPEDVFDTFYNDDTEFVQPFIETSFSKVLPIMSKIEVEIGDSKAYYMVARYGTVKQSGIMLLRMYLIGMTGELEVEG